MCADSPVWVAGGHQGGQVWGEDMRGHSHGPQAQAPGQPPAHGVPHTGVGSFDALSVKLSAVEKF